MSNVSLPRFPDLVLVSFAKNPLHPNSRFKVVDACVIGSAKPCNHFLKEGELFHCAKECLLKNGFTVVSRSSTGVSGYELFER